MTLVWGGTFPLIKIMLKYISPMPLIFYRFLPAAVICFPFLISGIRKTNLKTVLRLFFLGFLLWVAYITQTIGLRYTTPSNSAFITGLYVIFTPIFALFLTKEKMTKTMFLSLLLAILGIILLSNFSFTEFSFNLGNIITILSAISFALQIVFTSIFVKQESIIFITSVQIYTVLFLTAPFIISNKTGNLPLWVILSILFLGTVASFVAILIETYSLKFIDPDRASILFTLEPLFAAVFSFVFIGERFALKEIFGSILIFIAMIAVIKNNKNAHQEL
jgi:drug/metabolite transporter (DMT)-like permease